MVFIQLKIGNLPINFQPKCLSRLCRRIAIEWRVSKRQMHSIVKVYTRSKPHLGPQWDGNHAFHQNALGVANHLHH